MLSINLEKVIKEDSSRYEFAVAVAKRARQIVDEAQEDKTILDEKPVSMAVDEIKDGICTYKSAQEEE